MGRRERRSSAKAAKGNPIRKPVKADKRVLWILGILTAVVVIVSYYLKYAS